MQPDGFDDLVADGVVSAERGHRLLEDQGDFIPADGTHLLTIGFQSGQVHIGLLPVPHITAQDDLPFHDATGLFDDAQNRTGGDALAATAFTDYAQRLPRVNVEAGSVDGSHYAFIRKEIGLEISHRQDGFTVATHKRH